MTGILNVGLAGAIERAPVAGQRGLAALRIFKTATDEGLWVRFAGEALAAASPLVCSENYIVSRGAAAFSARRANRSRSIQ